MFLNVAFRCLCFKVCHAVAIIMKYSIFMLELHVRIELVVKLAHRTTTKYCIHSFHLMGVQNSQFFLKKLKKQISLVEHQMKRLACVVALSHRSTSLELDLGKMHTKRGICRWTASLYSAQCSLGKAGLFKWNGVYAVEILSFSPEGLWLNSWK